MSKLDWSKAGLSNADPARVIDVGDYGAYADVKQKPVRKKAKTKAEIAAIDHAEELRAYKAALEKYGKLPRKGKSEVFVSKPPKTKKSGKKAKPNRPATKLPLPAFSAAHQVFAWQGVHIDLVRSMWGKGLRARSIAKLIEGATKADVMRLAKFLGLSMDNLPTKVSQDL